MGMLVLTRRAGESILIGDDIEITVFKIDGAQVKVGIQAPKHVRILRNEIAKRVGEHLATGRSDRAGVSEAGDL